MRLGFIKDESGKLVRKWVKEGEEGKDPDVLHQVSSLFGDYIWTDEEHMEDAKEELLEGLFNAIRELAKNDKFWIVKREADWRNDAQNDPVREIQQLSVEEWIPQAAKEGKATVAWKIMFPTYDGYYTWEEAEQLQKELDACFSPNEK